jgi:hypothetical protein
MKNIKIDGDPDLYRDSDSNAIINTNNAAYENYIKAKKHRESSKNEIQNLKDEIVEIKSLLNILINKS